MGIYLFSVLSSVLFSGSMATELYDQSTPRCPQAGAIAFRHSKKKSVVICGGTSKFKVGEKYFVTRDKKSIGSVLIVKGTTKESVADIVEGDLIKGDIVSETPIK